MEYLENEARQSFPIKETSLIIILVSMLYAHVKHRTKVDRELETLCRIGVVSFVRVTETDWGVVRRDRLILEYSQLIKNQDDKVQFFESFLGRQNRVVNLQDEMETQDEKIRISRLQGLGFIIKPRERVSEFRSWLITPRLKYFRHNLVKGRSELWTKHLSRVRSRRISKKRVLSIKLFSTWLSSKFLLKDAIGRGVLTELDPSGSETYYRIAS
jgi:hypothetical protein